MLTETNFHLFVIFVTVIYYFIQKKNKLKSNMAILLNVSYIPIVLYTLAYLLKYTSVFNSSIQNNNIKMPEPTSLFKGNVNHVYPSSVDII